MKVRYLGLFFPALLILLGLAACKTTPPEPEPVPEEQVIVQDPDLAAPDQASLNRLNEAIARTEQARKLVQEFDGDEVFPADWNAAEGLYNNAQNGRKATVKDVRETLALYNNAASAYDALADKTIPLYAAQLENEVVAARNTAINAGAGYLAQDYLQGTDDFAADALAKYEAKDYYQAREDGLLVRDAYNALAVGVDAYKIRMEIEDRNFVRYDTANINAADQIAFSALDDYEGHNIASAATRAGDVRARYSQSLERAKESFSADSAAAANAERQKALDIKANVAVKADYDAANELLNQGNAAAQRRNFDQSADLYIQSRIMFEAATASAAEKRRLAEQALRDAELKMAESDEAARRAELIIEGGSR